jgi:hypothetical protein
VDWHKRALQEKDEFVKFLLLFIALEVSVKLKFSKIRDVKQDNSIKDEFYHNISQKYLKRLKHELDKNPLQNMSPDGDHRWPGKLDSINDFDGIIEFIIRARNNLFHGDKELDKKRDMFIVKEGTEILEPLVRIIIHALNK